MTAEQKLYLGLNKAYSSNNKTATVIPATSEQNAIVEFADLTFATPPAGFPDLTKTDFNLFINGVLVETDAIDSIVPMAYGNLALDLILKGVHGRLVVLKNGRYDNVPIDVVVGKSKLVNIDKFYNTERLRPYYNSFEMNPLFIMTSEG